MPDSVPLQSRDHDVAIWKPHDHSFLTVAVSSVHTATNYDFPSHLPMAEVHGKARREGCKAGSHDVSLNDFSTQGSKIRWGEGVT